MKRIVLFIATNLAVLALLSIVIFVIEQVFGIRLAQGGLGGLLVFAAVFGFEGALISLALSKWTAKRIMGMPEEISHVANGDMVTLALLQGVLNTFVIFLARIIGGIVDRAQIVLGILPSIIVSWYSRRREFRADRGAANLAGSGSMIAALQVLKRSHGEPMPRQMQAFGINTGASSGFMRLFMSHPPLDERIAALQSQETR